VADERLRLLERQAACDPIRSAELLVARMRRGDLTLDRVELAAWCGDPAARAAVSDCDGIWTVSWERGTWWGKDSSPHTWLTVIEWAKGIERWGYEAAVRATVAAARVALAAWESGEETCCCGSTMRGHGWGDGHAFTHACTYYTQDQPEGLFPCECFSPNPRLACEAAEAWIKAPSRVRLLAWYDARDRALPSNDEDMRLWLPWPDYPGASDPPRDGNRSPSDLAADMRIDSADAFVGGGLVVAAAGAALTSWALSSERTS
jgi:hypothetical protein